MFGNPQKVCIAICSPHRANDVVTVAWHRARMAMSMPTNINTFELFADGLEVGDARSQVAAMVLAHKPEPPEFLFFIDDDVVVPLDALTKLFVRARCFPKYDVYAGVYCLKRGKVPEPLIYGEPGQGPIWDWAVGDLLTTERHGVRATHMGLTLIRTSLFQRIRDAKLVGGDGADQLDEPFFQTTHEERKVKDGKILLQMGTEDIYFYSKAAKVDCRIMVDTSVLAGHQDKATGATYGLPLDYGPALRAKWMTRGGKSMDRAASEVDCSCDHGSYEHHTYGTTRCLKCNGTGKVAMKLALDIGAGSDRREWPGYVTYTTDMRPDTSPDYVMDTRLLNLPDDHFDLVASSHHLEHLGRFDQEQAWREMFRITVPGGRFEHNVPSIDWAACKIKDGFTDMHVYNVLYGAQESHGYARELNTHYFGYGKVVARALAEQAGYVDVATRDWRDDPSLGYTLVITGRKPGRDCKEVEKSSMYCRCISTPAAGERSMSSNAVLSCRSCEGTGIVKENVVEHKNGRVFEEMILSEMGS